MGRLYYPNSNMNACLPFNPYLDLPSEFLMDERSDIQPVIMVDRGNCSFVTKVRNIEKLGVHLAIIADDRPEESENLVMSDDGTGSSVNIPSFIICKKDADVIKASLNSNN